VGKLVETAANGLKLTLVKAGVLAENYTPQEFVTACGSYIEQFGPLKSFSQYEAPPGIYWDDETYRGDAYGAFAWAVYVAEVAVDTLTFETTVQDFVALQEVGRVIHPVLAAGQIEGGVAQGIGFALYENVVWDQGRMANSQMTNYIMPTSVDVPRIRVYFEETPYEYGPMGAKGIGELPIDGPAPAVLNAIEDAIGTAVNEIPLTPEKLMQALLGSEALAVESGVA
jgi:CO/xanthine dehydrogenase Mo-binding subunit